jgi:hypothetical protein
VGHLSMRNRIAVCVGTLLLLVGWSTMTSAGPPQNGHADNRGPVYQMHANGGSPRGRGGSHAEHNHGRFPIVNAPQINSGSFQRPYPYHLDYYRMRYGGSYAPYFGNLYGPPQVVTAPPYFGPYFGGGYGEFGVGNPAGTAVAPPGYCPCDPVVPVERQSQ